MREHYQKQHFFMVTLDFLQKLLIDLSSSLIHILVRNLSKSYPKQRNLPQHIQFDPFQILITRKPLIFYGNLIEFRSISTAQFSLRLITNFRSD